MKKITLAFIQIITFSIITITPNLYAYKIDTHQNITRKAIGLSDSLEFFISEFELDIEEAIQNVVYGSATEDEFPRFFNHFYDPVNEAGLNGGGVPLGFPAPSWGYDNNSNQYSWTGARGYMYQAITGGDQNNRNTNFRNLFLSLGQVIHLIQDMTQPSHVRNDPHASHHEPLGAVLAPSLTPSHLEDWAKGNENEIISYIDTVTGPRSVDTFDDAFEMVALFSNQNFFSDDTIFEDYEFPSEEETNYTEDFLPMGIGDVAQVVAEDGETYFVPYIIKAEGVYTGYKLAQVGYFGPKIHNFPKALAFQIDDEVAKENAAILIPRAVGYSAGLLDYFFRGELDAEADGSDGIKIMNKYSEDMNGTFALYYDDENGERKQADGGSWAFSLAAGETSSALTFSAPDDAKDPGTYVLVFKGQMGQEGFPSSDSEFTVAAKNIVLSQVNYLFIVPEVLELISSTEGSSDSGFKNCSYVVDGETKEKSIWSDASRGKSWDSKKQLISGRFVRYGSAYIEKITRAFLNYGTKVYLDGILVDPNTWTGSPDNQPKTWKMISENFSPYAGPQPGLVVQLSDGQIFELPLITYDLHTYEDQNRSEKCIAKDGEFYNKIDKTWVFLSAGTSIFLAETYGQVEIHDYTGESYKILNFSGYENDPGEDYYCNPSDNVFWACFWINTTFGRRLNFTMNGHHNFLLSEPGLDYFPRMYLTGEVQYTTPPDKVNQLQALGLSPIDYVVKLK
jgi:hypothetical protein